MLLNIVTLQGKAKYTPSWVKVKYGAWYLSPRTWKARPTDEPLQDPKAQQDKTLSESKKKSQKLVSCTVLQYSHVTSVSFYLFELVYKKIFPLDGQMGWAKFSLQLVNLPSAWLFNETPDLWQALAHLLG